MKNSKIEWYSEDSGISDIEIMGSLVGKVGLEEILDGLLGNHHKSTRYSSRTWSHPSGLIIYKWGNTWSIELEGHELDTSDVHLYNRLKALHPDVDFDELTASILKYKMERAPYLDIQYRNGQITFTYESSGRSKGSIELTISTEGRGRYVLEHKNGKSTGFLDDFYSDVLDKTKEDVIELLDNGLTSLTNGYMYDNTYFATFKEVEEYVNEKEEN